MSWFTKAGLNTIVLLWALWCRAAAGAPSWPSLQCCKLTSLQFSALEQNKCEANNRFSSIILWHKNQMVVSLSFISPLWFSNDKWLLAGLGTLGWGAVVKCIAEYLGRQLNTDWKFAECCSTHSRFIWKQTRTVSGTNMPMGGKLGETSSGTVPTPMLHGISTSFRTSKSKGTKNIFFQYYCSVEPTSFCMWFLYVTSSLESEVFINKIVWQFHKSSVFCRSVHKYTASVVPRPKQLLVVGCCMRGGGRSVTSHYVTMSPHRVVTTSRESLPPDSDSEICIIHTAGDGETFCWEIIQSGIVHSLSSGWMKGIDILYIFISEKEMN